MKISVIIPAKNEEKTIKRVFAKVSSLEVVGEIILVDDGSSDATARIINDLLKTQVRGKKIKAIFQKTSRGKGSAIIAGIKKASCPYVIIQDADLEYDPDEYEKLLKKATFNNAVYGSRILNGNAHAYHRTYWGNVLITNICNILFRVHLTDSYTCYKLMSTKVAKSLNLGSLGFEIEAEITGKLIIKKIPIIEVPISYNPRKYEQGKKIKAKDALIGALTFLRVRLKKL